MAFDGTEPRGRLAKANDEMYFDMTGTYEHDG